MENKKTKDYSKKIITKKYYKKDLEDLLKKLEESIHASGFLFARINDMDRQIIKDVIPYIKEGIKEGQDINMLLLDLIYRLESSEDILICSLDELPLYTEDPKFNVIFNWRLKIGK